MKTLKELGTDTFLIETTVNLGYVLGLVEDIIKDRIKELENELVKLKQKRDSCHNSASLCYDDFLNKEEDILTDKICSAIDRIDEQTRLLGD